MIPMLILLSLSPHRSQKELDLELKHTDWKLALRSETLPLNLLL